MNETKEILEKINEITKRKEELWFSRIIPIEKNRKEIWIISLLNKKKKVNVKNHPSQILRVVVKNQRFLSAPKNSTVRILGVLSTARIPREVIRPLVNRRVEFWSLNNISKTLDSVINLDKNSEYWICEKKFKGKRLCTFCPKASKKPSRF